MRSLYMKGESMQNKLIHIPHSSQFIPEEFRKLFLIDNKTLERELLIMTDNYCDDMFDVSGIEKVIFPISRLICDVERFTDKEKEIMNRVGMGVCYEKTHDLKNLKIANLKHELEILKKYYYPHHKTLTNKVSKILEMHKNCIIFDCHSFPSKKLPYEINHTSKRPDICIGVDDFHTPNALANSLQDYFRSLGLTVSINTPFAGSIVPLEYYKKDKNVHSVMIEVNKKLYMNEQTGEKNTNYVFIKNLIRNIIKNIEIY